MNLKTTFLFAVISFVLTSNAFAQKQWTLEECIAHAMKNNLQIQQAENNLKISDQITIQSRGAALPNLNANGTHNYNFGRNIDPFTNQFTNSQVQSNNFGLNSSVILFNGLQIRNTIQQSRYEYLSLNYQIETLKNDISLTIAAAYLDILYTKELIKSLENQLNLSTQQLQRIKQLINAGTLAPTASIDLMAQIASEENQVIRTKNTLIVSFLNLTQLLDLPSEELFDIITPEVLTEGINAAPSFNADETVKVALENQPKLKSIEFKRLSTIEALNIAKGRQSPRLSLNASLSTIYSNSSKNIVGQELTGTARYIGYTQTTLEDVYTPNYQNIYEAKPFNAQIKDNYNRFLGFTLSIPIVNGLQTRTAIKRAKLTIDNTELDLRISKLDVEKNVRKAHTDVQIAYSNYNAANSALIASNEALVNSEKRFTAGLINSFEYNQSKNRATQAESDLLRAKYDCLFKQKIVGFYKGEPIK